MKGDGHGRAPGAEAPGAPATPAASAAPDTASGAAAHTPPAAEVVHPLNAARRVRLVE